MVGTSGSRRRTKRSHHHRSRKISAAAVVGALAPPRGRITRKQARKITTQFHRLVQQQQQTQQQQQPIAADGGATATTTTTSIHDDDVEALRVDYQRASQVSTSYFSTSKWILGCLIQNGWFYGIRTSEEETTMKLATTKTTGANDDASHDDDGQERPSASSLKKKKKKERRATRILEIGAINTELLDAAVADETGRGAKLTVRAIDLHSMHTGRIEKADFLTMPLPNDDNDDYPPYDVVVCSMVLNCVATPADRGTMLRRIHTCLRPDGGILFLTLPKTCLQLSPYINRDMLEDLLRAVGFTVHEHDKDSPKIAFFVATRNDNNLHYHHPFPNAADGSVQPKQWTQLTKIFRGSKYRNAFAVLLPPEVGS
jgi:type II secretory pathway pseudopilin PulG